MKALFAAVAVLVLLACCSCEQRAAKTADNPPRGKRRPQAEAIPPASPGMELQPIDYAVLRKTFHTRLTRRGRSPQAFQPLRAPQGARLLDYTSGQLTLKAVVGPVSDMGPRKPAVVFLHGGFAYGDDPGDSDWEMSQPYRDAGFVVMTPVLRGENGQPGDFSLYYNEVNDVLAAAEALARLPNVDPQRIFVSGHSAGGTLAILTALTSSRFRAAASLSGTLDQSRLRREPSALVCFEPQNLREFQMRSPVAFATSFKCPARLYYGSEELWAADETRRTAALARRRRLDVLAKVMAGDHFSSVPAGIRDSIAFFKRY